MRKISILLVEDNDDDRFLTKRIIRKLPFEVHMEIAKNGDEAAEQILDKDAGGKKLPTLVLLDLQLPKIGGLELLTRIRNRYSNKDLPVIILSSSDNPGDIALCKELGINGYLSKPLVLAELMKTLNTVVACHKRKFD